MVNNWLAPAVTASVLAALMMLLVYYYLFTVYQDNYLKLWVIASSASFIRYSLILVQYYYPQLLLSILIHTTMLLHAYFFFNGMMKFANQKWSPMYRAITGFAIIWTITATLIKSNYLVITLISYSWAGIMLVLVGYRLLQSDFPFKSKFLGLNLVLWGFHKIDYPFLRPVEWFAPFGFLLAAMFENATSLIVLIIFFEAQSTQLQLTENMFERLFDKSQNALFMVVEERVVKTNPAFRVMTGYRVDDDLTITDLIVSTEHGGIASERVIRTRNGNHITCLMNKFSVSSDHKDIFYSLIDISELKQYQERELVRNKLDSLNVFSGGIAHEFNNMLMGISGNLEIIETMTSEGSEVIEYLENIKTIITNSKSIVNSMRQLSNTEVRNSKQIDLFEVVEEVVQFLEVTTSRQVVKLNLIPQGKLIVNMERSDLYQILVNLSVNAMHAVQTTKDARIEFRECRDFIFCPPESGYISFAIVDNGYGMDEETIRKCVEPFFSTKKDTGMGSGLGLSIVNNLVIQKYGGDIQIESEVDEGTIIRVKVPVGSSNGQFK